ncbi:LysR family transcriptional regulator [Thalassotalea sp. 42_200_T64]|nr:LysR family transcriptional regulator [Thalassotalea sp. 42_200_T64]
MDNLHLMNVYVAVAEEQGFAAGARRLAMSPPAVTRAIAALEEKLGVKLLTRTTRYVRTTDAGLRYLTDAKRILNDVHMANEAAAGINAAPTGHLAITAPVMFGRMFVMPGIIDYLNQYPNTEVDAIFLDRVVNLLEEGLDVGVRIGELPNSSMRALRVGSVRLILCAAPEYLQRNGIPQQPADLSQHTIISSRAMNNSSDWRFEQQAQKYQVNIKPRVTVTTNDAAIEAALSGFGLTRLLSYQVAPYLASGQLNIVMENYEPAAKPVHIVHRESHLTTAKVRAFIDLMAKRLRNDNALN